MTLTYVLVVCFWTPFTPPWARFLLTSTANRKLPVHKHKSISTSSQVCTRAHRILDQTSILEPQTTQDPHGCPHCTIPAGPTVCCEPLARTIYVNQHDSPFLDGPSFLLACGNFRCRSNAERSRSPVDSATKRPHSTVVRLGLSLTDPASSDPPTSITHHCL